MNRFYLMIVSYLIVGTVFVNAQTLVPDQNAKGKWGYVNLDGKKVIDYKFKEAYSFIDGKAKVKKGDKWGYINAKGREEIKIKYSEMYEWTGDYCKVAEGGSVKDGVLTKAKWGFINRRGEVVIKSEYDEIGTFQDGFAFIKKGEKYGYLNANYQVAIPCKYAAVGTFNERGYLWVNEGGKFDKKKNPDIVKGGKFGVYKRNGVLVVPVKYKAIGTFEEVAPDANPLMASIFNSPEYIKEVRKIKKEAWGLVKVTPNKKAFNFAPDFDFSKAKAYGESHMEELQNSYIAKMSGADQQLAKECGSYNLLTYQLLYPKKFSQLPMTNNTYIAVSDKMGILNANGETNQYDYRKTNEKFFNKIGIIDGDGNMLMPASKFEMAYCPSDGFIPVVNEKKKKLQLNYYNIKTGKLLFKDKEWIETELVTPFEHGNAVIATNKKQYLIDKQGKKISKEYSLILPMRESIYVVKSGDKCGIIDSTGREVIAPTYNLISPVSEGLMCAQKEKDGQYGYLNKTGEFAIPATYDYAFSFKYGWASVQTKSGWGEIDANNKEIVKCRWSDIMLKTEWKPKLMWVKKEKEGLWYCLSTEKDQLVFDTGYSGCRNFNVDTDGVAVVWTKEGKVGCISTNGDVIISCVMPDSKLMLKAYAEMNAEKKGVWKDIDTYRFIIRNTQSRNEYELTGTIDENMWDY